MGMRENCKLCKDGKCYKWIEECTCKPIEICAFDEKFKVCDVNESCELASIYGNDLYVITDEDIANLKNGKVLYDLSEYGIFIAYKKGCSSDGYGN